jgi:DNA-binding IclR family transcriptional regulator
MARQLVQSVDRALRILSAFVGETSLSLNEISQRVNLTPSTTHRLLHTLREHRFIEQQSDNRYRLGVRLLILSQHVPLGAEVRRVALPEMRKLADEVTLAASLFIIHNFRAVCVEHVPSRNPIRIMVSEVGMSLPLNCGAAPRALLSNLSDHEITQLHKDEYFQRLTAHSVRRVSDILQDAAEIRQKGYVMAVEDILPDVAAIGVPIFGKSEACCGAISLIGTLSEFNNDRRDFLVAAVRDTATRISKRLVKREFNQNDLERLEHDAG